MDSAFSIQSLVLFGFFVASLARIDDTLPRPSRAEPAKKGATVSAMVPQRDRDTPGQGTGRVARAAQNHTRLFQSVYPQPAHRNAVRAKGRTRGQGGGRPARASSDEPRRTTLRRSVAQIVGGFRFLSRR